MVMVDRFENREDLAVKIAWEGGLDLVMDYGIHVRNMPEGDIELQELWTELESAWDKYVAVRSKVEELLPSEAW
jgi:hypothetical protein